MSDSTTQVIAGLSSAATALQDAAQAALAAQGLIADQGQQIATLMTDKESLADQLTLAKANAADLQGQLDAANAKLAAMSTPPVVTPPVVDPPVVTPPVTELPDAAFVIRPNEAGMRCDFDGTPCAPDADKLKYRWTWNFGDGSPEVEGFNAAHCYDQPGSYTVTLKLQPIDDKGDPTGATPVILHDTISVAPSTRKIINVPAGADLHDYNNASGAELVLSAAAYTASNTISLTRSLIRGNGATINPSLLPSGNGFTLFVTDDCRIDSLTVDWAMDAGAKTAAYGKAGAAIRPKGRTAVTHCTFRNVADAVNCNGSPDGVLIENCNAPLLDGIRGYFCWVQGKNICLYNNVVANCVVNHVVRSEATTANVAVYGNDFSNVGSVVSGISGDNSKACVEFHDGDYLYVAKNKFRGDGSNGGGDGAAWGPLGLQLDSGGSVFCGMQIDNDVQGLAGVSAGASDIAILGNRFIVQDPWFKASAAIVITTHDGIHPDAANITIGGNTADAKYKPLAISDGAVTGLVSDWGVV